MLTSQPFRPNGGLIAFSGANAVTGADSSATGTPDADTDSAVTLANGHNYLHKRIRKSRTRTR